MLDKKYRIAGYDSELAKRFPEAADAIEVAGKDKSNLCYECVRLAIRAIGFNPKTKNEIRDFLAIVSNLNKYGVNPSMNGSKANMKGYEANTGIFSSENENINTAKTEKQVAWSDPDMEEDFIDEGRD